MPGKRVRDDACHGRAAGGALLAGGTAVGAGVAALRGHGFPHGLQPCASPACRISPLAGSGSSPWLHLGVI